MIRRRRGSRKEELRYDDISINSFSFKVTGNVLGIIQNSEDQGFLLVASPTLSLLVLDLSEQVCKNYPIPNPSRLSLGFFVQKPDSIMIALTSGENSLETDSIIIINLSNLS